jgi:peptidyl-prolyl cis-trans isomerase SurA
MRLPLVLVCVALAGTARAGDKHELDRVVAVVNHVVILKSELDARVVALRADAQSIPDPAERARRVAKLANLALEEMIDEELVVQAGEAQHFEVLASEVDAAIEDVKRQMKIDDKALADGLAQEGLTLDAFRTVKRRQLIYYRTISQLVAPKMEVSEDDVKARYAQLQRGEGQVSAVQLAHILIALPEHPTEQELSRANARAQQIVARVKAGESFAAVCTDSSDDASTKATGGELGWFLAGTLDNGWEPVVFAMAKGEVRGPLPGAGGLHVLQVTDVQQAHLGPYDEMKPQLRRELEQRELSRRTQSWVEDLRKKAYIDIKL